MSHEEWITFFPTVLTESCKRIIATVDRIPVLQSSHHDRLCAISRSSSMIARIDMLFENP